MTLEKQENLEKKQEQPSNQPDLKDQVIEEPAEKSEQDFYTKNITRIEGGNLRGGAPGRVNGKRTVESTEKAVKTIHEKFHPNTVISFENTEDDSANTEILTAEKKAWTELGVKFIELPVKETEFNKLFDEGLKSKTLEAFAALDNGGTFVHCTHGLQRARAFTEIWRATRGIDRRKAIQENPNLNNENKSEGHRKCGNDVQEIIKRILENPLEARKELSKEVAPTPEALTDKTIASKMALIGDSIGEGISETIAAKFPEHEVHAVSSARIAEGKKYKPVSAQLEEIDPQKTPYLVIQGGTNDVDHTNDPATIAESLKNLYEKAKSKGFKKVVVVTIPPHTNEKYRSKINSVNAQLRIFAQKGEINLYDLNAEYLKIDPKAENINEGGVHPTNKGYKILAELLLKNLKEKLSEESKEKLAEAVGTTLAEQPQSNEHLSEKSKELQKKLEKEIEAITEEQRKQDEQKLSQAEIKDIRFNTALLNGDEDKVKEEMTHRLAQYTEKQEDGSLRINYAKFNSSGRDHEMNIGLGDIMPPEYKKIAVVTSGGSVRIGTRGLVSTSKESNRVGYIDEATGGYLATFTGDKIYVLDPLITDEKELAELLAKEKEARKNGSQNFNEYTSRSEGGGSFSDSNGEYSFPTETQSGTGEVVENLTLKDRAINGLNKNIEGKKNWNHSNLEIEGWKYNPNLSEGENIYNFSVIICQRKNLGQMIPVIWGIVNFESDFDTFNTNSSGATGLGQIKQKYFNSEYLEKWRKSNDPVAKVLLQNNNPSLTDPFINIYATIQKTEASIKRYRKEGINIMEMPVKDQIRYLYLMHHDGPAGAISMLRFLERMKQLGVNTESKEEVLKFMQSGTPEADTAISLLHGDRNSSTERRARTNPSRFLGPWYSYSQEKIAKYALAGTMKESQPQQPAQTTELTTGLTRDEQILAKRIRSMPKPNFDYDAVYMLGCGEPRENHKRAVAAAELALKNNAAFLTSGGATEEYKKIGTTEGNEAFNYIKRNPYYSQKFTEAGIKTGIEDQSGSTNSNITNAVNFFHSQGFKRILVVTTESGEGTRSTHGTEGAKKLKRALGKTGVEVAFYSPERPNIDRNLA